MAAEAPPSWSADIQPLFAQRCTECHGEHKAKAKLRLHTREAVLAGAFSGPVVVPGKAADSSLYDLIRRPADDPDLMPPKGKLLTPAQVDLVRRWIDGGAP